VTGTAKGDGLKSDHTEDADAGYSAVNGGTVRVTSVGDGVGAATSGADTGGLAESGDLGSA
jgi:hypothetical protein